jgi:hypothetical protein
LRCAAYPKGIPDEIIEGKVDHTEPYKGDGGKVYEPVRMNSLAWAFQRAQKGGANAD